jgi:hypothetical protein
MLIYDYLELRSNIHNFVFPALPTSTGESCLPVGRPALCTDRRFSGGTPERTRGKQSILRSFRALTDNFGIEGAKKRQNTFLILAINKPHLVIAGGMITSRVPVDHDLVGKGL